MMTNKELKLASSRALKDRIQEKLLETPMTFSEIADYFNLTKVCLSSHLMALRSHELLVFHADDIENKVQFKRYVALKDKPKFSELIAQNAIDYSKTMRPKYEPSSPNSRIILGIDTIRTTSSRKSRISAWTGYTSFGGV